MNALGTQLSNDNDVVICYAKRTPLTKSKKGPLGALSPEIMLSALLTDLQVQIPKSKDLVQDVIVGNVLQTGKWCGGVDNTR